MTGNFFPRGFTPGLQYVANCTYVNLPDPAQFNDGTQAWVTDFSCPMTVIDGRWVSGSVLLTRQTTPLVKMPSFTGGAAGAFTLDTDIDYAWPQCFGFFDEDVLEVGSPAGWYPCEMSSTTEGVVYNNPLAYVPAPGVVPIFPTELTPFEDPIVGGNGFVGDILYYVVPLWAYFFVRGFINFDGMVASSLSSDLKIDVDGQTFVQLTDIPAQLLLDALNMHATDANNQQLGLSTLSLWAQFNVDMTQNQNVSIYMTSNNIDSYMTLFNYALIGDNR